MELIKAKSLWLATGIAGLALVAGALLIFAREDSTPRSAATETRIFISDDLLNAKLGLVTKPVSVAEVVRSLTVYSDGKKCITVSLRDSKDRGVRPDGVTIPESYERKQPFAASTGKVIVIGANGQPDICSKEGATLTLVDAQGRELWEEFEVKVGAAYELTSVGPKPPGSGESDEGVPNAESGEGAPIERSSTDWLERALIGAGIGALAGLFLAYAYMRRKSPRART